jgi:hypothetical protein
MESSMTPTANLIPAQEQQPQQQQAGTTSFTPFVWKFFSVCSWSLLVFTSLDGFLTDSMFYSVHRNANLAIKIGTQKFSFYIPNSINLGILGSFYLIILLIAFFNFAYLGLYKKDESIINPMFDNISNYHFVPLLLISIINILMGSTKGSPKIEDINGELISDLVFTIVALGFLIIIYYKTQLNHEWYIVLTIKKGLFSILIILLWHNFFYKIVLVGYINQGTSIEGFLKGTGITFSILIGLGSLIFSFAFKDLMAAVTNFLIYVGMINSFFGPKGKDKEQKELFNGVGEGVIDIIMMIINLAFIVFLILKHTDGLFKNEMSFKPN